MRTKQFIFALAATMMIGFTSCDSDEPTTEEENQEQNEENEENEEESTYACLNGSDYYLFALDAVTYETISSKVVEDMRTDDMNTVIYVWESTYTAKTASGPNFFGEVEGWTALEVASVGWSGLGLCILSAESGGTKTVDLTDIYNNAADYTFHIAMRSTDTYTHTLKLVGSDGNETSITIGDGGTTNFTRDGEWQEIEIPMTTFTGLGLIYREGGQTGNVLCILSGGVAGTTLEFDACFIYKK